MLIQLHPECSWEIDTSVAYKVMTYSSTSMTSANQSTNTPSKNYAVMDVLKNDGANTSTMVFSEGNTRVTGTGGSDGGAFSTLSTANIWNNRISSNI